MKDELVITEGLLESSNKLAAEDATEHKQIQTFPETPGVGGTSPQGTDRADG
jgi:hypothetical protein